MTARIVVARSPAEMPVVTPRRASIDAPNGCRLPAASGTISGMPSCRMRSRVRLRHTSPRACVAMKLMASAVTMLGRHAQVGLALRAVGQDHHAAVAQVLQGALDRMGGHRRRLHLCSN